MRAKKRLQQSRAAPLESDDEDGSIAKSNRIVAALEAIDHFSVNTSEEPDDDWGPIFDGDNADPFRRTRPPARGVGMFGIAPKRSLAPNVASSIVSDVETVAGRGGVEPFVKS
jgi:hypothetical protein